MLLKQPAFTLPVLLALALGIGVNTTIFGFVDGLLFRPLPIDRLEEVVRISAVDPDRNPTDYFNSLYPIYSDYRDQATSFAGLAAYADSQEIHLTVGNGKPQRLIGGLVTGTYFDVLRSRAWRGRLIAADDDRKPGSHPVAVISYGLWRRSFGGRDDAIGTRVRINSHPFTVIGVAPPGFVGVSLDNLPELWMPMAMAAEAMPEIARDFKPLESRHFFWIEMVGRLKPHTTIAQAQAELDVIARRRAAPEPKNDREPFAAIASAASLVTQTQASSRYRQMSWVLIGVVGLVLLIACGDAAGLLLVRGEQRQREIAIRVAVGASRWRIVRQLLVESLAIAVVASVAGVLVASWSADGLLALLPSDFPIVPGVGGFISQPRVLTFTVVVSLISGLVFGLAPAVRASRPNLVPALKQDPAMAHQRPGHAAPHLCRIADRTLRVVAGRSRPADPNGVGIHARVSGLHDRQDRGRLGQSVTPSLRRGSITPVLPDADPRRPPCAWSLERGARTHGARRHQRDAGDLYTCRPSCQRRRLANGGLQPGVARLFHDVGDSAPCRTGLRHARHGDRPHRRHRQSDARAPVLRDGACGGSAAGRLWAVQRQRRDRGCRRRCTLPQPA